MKLIIDAATEAEVTVNIGGWLLEIEVTNVPEDRQWKIDELRGERDYTEIEARANEERHTTLIHTVTALEDELTALKLTRMPIRNKINAIKRAREITNWGLKESKDLVDAIFMAAGTL